MFTKTLLATLALVSGACADAVTDEWIVMMKPGTTKMGRYSHQARTGLAREDIFAEWTIGDFNAYAFKGSENKKLYISEFEDVAEVVENTIYYTDDCESLTARTGAWGLARTTSRNIPSNLNDYRVDTRSNLGANTVSYVLDTGIRTTHESFQGRASWGAVFTGDGEVDQNGHGSHVAGTMVGRDTGFAINGEVVAVKVLSNTGSGSTAGIISGMEWTAADCARRGLSTCVSNMSLGGGRNTAFNAAVDACRAQGILMVVSAGNNGNALACNNSPASADGAYTVGSTTNTDARSSFSNVGTCVDIFAPGSSIMSTGFTSDTHYRSISGTSMAAPQVAGVAQVMLSNNPSMTVDDLERALSSTAVEGMISDLPSDTTGDRVTVNLLLQQECQETAAQW